MDDSGAFKAHNTALSLRGDFYEALFNRGHDLILLNDYAGAEESLGQAITLQPNDAHALKYRALALHGLGREVEAKELMARAKCLQPDILDNYCKKSERLFMQF